MKLFLLPLLLLLTGCVSFNRSGTTHHLILGIGIVSVNQTNAVAATVVKTQALGLSVDDTAGAAFTLGYTTRTTLQVKTNQNALIEVSSPPFSPLRVDIQDESHPLP